MYHQISSNTYLISSSDICDSFFQTIITTMSEQNVPVVYRLIDEAKEDLDSLLDESQRYYG